MHEITQGACLAGRVGDVRKATERRGTPWSAGETAVQMGSGETRREIWVVGWVGGFSVQCRNFTLHVY